MRYWSLPIGCSLSWVVSGLIVVLVLMCSFLARPLVASHYVLFLCNGIPFHLCQKNEILMNSHPLNSYFLKNALKYMFRETHSYYLLPQTFTISFLKNNLKIKEFPVKFFPKRNQNKQINYDSWYPKKANFLKGWDHGNRFGCLYTVNLCPDTVRICQPWNL